MKPISAQFETHLDGEATTLCHCWIVHRSDGTALGFTDHDESLQFEGVDFEPQSGFTASEAEHSQGMGVDMLDVAGALDSEQLTDADIEQGLYDGAEVRVFAVNWQDPQDRVELRRVRIATITRTGDAFRAELVSPAAQLDRPRGRIYARHCDAVLGDTRCGKDISVDPFAHTGVVSSVHPDGISVTGQSDLPAGWFSGGTATWTDGSDERTARIADHLVRDGAARLSLGAGDPVPPQGASLALAAGCDKRFATCRDKFANQNRFRGFPHLPGNDAAYAYVTEGRDFDGEPLVP